MIVQFEISEEVIKRAAKEYDRPVKEVKESIEMWFNSYTEQPDLAEELIGMEILNF